MLGSISQHSLHRCRLELEDRPLEGASLFPFFDDQGTTKAVMIVTEASRRILLHDWRPDLFTRRWWRPHRLRLHFTSLEDATASEAELLEDLWHFDPWWVLGEERYSGHDAALSLLRTNLPGYDEALTRMWFDDNLERVTWVATGSGESMKIRRFAKHTLAIMARPRRDTSSTPSMGRARSDRSGRSGRSDWRLRPFWE